MKDIVGIECLVCDPIADEKDAKHEYGIEFTHLGKMKNLDVMVVAVAHDVFRKLDTTQVLSKDGAKVLIDIKSIYSRKEQEKLGHSYWCF